MSFSSSTPKPVHTPIKRRHIKVPLTPAPTPTRLRPPERKRYVAASVVAYTPPRVFIGRLCCPPFVYRNDTHLARTNVTWLKTGELNELDYDDEILQSSGRGTVMKRKSDPSIDTIDLTLSDVDEVSENVSTERRAKRRRQAGRLMADERWGQGQHKAIWNAQLRYGEGQAWDKVMRMVNQADPIRPKTLQNCQKYWKLSRQKLLDYSVTGW